MRQKITAIIISIFLLFSLTGCEENKQEGKSTAAQGNCVVHFINIGQGDATLIQIDDSYSLIDTGTVAHYDDLSTYLDAQNVNHIENMIVTHPDADHMGGAYKVIQDYDVSNFYTTNTTNESQAYQKMIRSLKQEKLKKQVVASGDRIDFGKGSQGKVFGPIGESEDNNESSLVIRLDYGENSFLFTGDTTARMENKINEKYDIDVDVLKASHHGSDTANGVMFIRDASPMYSIISVGANNNYGHPDSNVLRRLEKYSTEDVLRTDEDGSIVISSDGKELSVQSSDDIQLERKDRTPLKKSVKKSETSKADEIIGNKNTKIYHKESESRLPDEKNREYFSSVEKAKKAGYRACEKCYQ